MYDTMTMTDFIAHASMKNVAFSVYIVINSNLAGVALHRHHTPTYEENRRRLKNVR